jgi:hypothetical protein
MRTLLEALHLWVAAISAVLPMLPAIGSRIMITQVSRNSRCTSWPAKPISKKDALTKTLTKADYNERKSTYPRKGRDANG